MLFKVEHTLLDKMIVCFIYQVDHTYDRSFVMKQLQELEELLVNLIQPHLTDKSVGRVDQVSTYNR